MKIAYENEECPEGCSLVHDVPPRGRMSCPETGTLYVLCDRCDEWFDPDYYEDNASLMDRGQRITLCDPARHGFVQCSGCEAWVRSDDAFEPCYNSSQFCLECWSGCDCGDCRSQDYEDGGTEPGEHVTMCRSCGTGNLYLDLLSEEFFCKCGMDAMLTVEPTRPFKVPVAA